MTKNCQIRRVQDSDLAAIADLDYEACSPCGTAENPETFVARFKTFPAGFVVLEENNEIAAYGCSEKWLAERGFIRFTLALRHTLIEQSLRQRRPRGILAIGVADGRLDLGA
jgi:hypothetical protein